MLCWEIIAVPRLAHTTNTPCGQKADLHTGTALFWVITQRPLKMGPIGCPETSARNCHFTLRNNLKELSYRLLRVGSPKSSRLSHLQSMAATELHTISDCSSLSCSYKSRRSADSTIWRLRHELLITSAVPVRPTPAVPSVAAII